MKVKDLMTTGVITVKPTDTVNNVAEVLFQRHFTGLPVVDGSGRLMGLIAERDFITSDSRLYLPTYIKLLTDIDFISKDKNKLSADAKAIIEATAADIMNRQVISVSPDTELAELAEIFATKRVNPIPVVDQNQKLIGIISRSDLIKLFSKKHLSAKVENFTPLPRPIDEEVQSAQKDFHTRFAYVAKFRANIWLTTAIVLFIIGFLGGIIYVVNPNYFFGG